MLNGVRYVTGCQTIIDSTTLTALSSIFAVIVSIISVIFTVIFSLLQIKHNKNSVRPISSIQLCDYEDLLSVEIENAGTGPLIIKTLKVKDDQREAKELISLMPHINQHWTTFTEEVDGWTLPVGGSITLVELHPDDDIVKQLVRKKLSKITVYLDYTDIFATKFHDERALTFFGRHFG